MDALDGNQVSLQGPDTSPTAGTAAGASQVSPSLGTVLDQRGWLPLHPAGVRGGSRPFHCDGRLSYTVPGGGRRSPMPPHHHSIPPSAQSRPPPSLTRGHIPTDRSCSDVLLERDSQTHSTTPTPLAPRPSVRQLLLLCHGRSPLSQIHA